MSILTELITRSSLSVLLTYPNVKDRIKQQGGRIRQHHSRSSAGYLRYRARQVRPCLPRSGICSTFCAVRAIPAEKMSAHPLTRAERCTSIISRKRAAWLVRRSLTKFRSSAVFWSIVSATDPPSGGEPDFFLDSAQQLKYFQIEIEFQFQLSGKYQSEGGNFKVKGMRCSCNASPRRQ